jgi:hypothetical protein
MGNLKDKVESLVAGNLAGASVELEEVPRIEKLSGLVIWEGFAGKPQRERQRELWSVLRHGLQEEEQLSLSAILTLTPAEQRTFLAENN